MAIGAEDAARRFRERALHARGERERRAAELRARVERRVQGLLPARGKAWLIGSLASGDFGERSDVDLVLSGVGPADAARIEEAVAKLAGVEVDLLQLEELPESFRRRIQREGLDIELMADALPSSDAPTAT